MAPPWLDRLNADPLPWLLEPSNPAVRHVALRDLLDRPKDDSELLAARASAMANDPIATILANQEPEGYWVKAGAGYGPKYMGTTWQVIFLAQLGADAADARVHRAGDYVLSHTPASTGGFGAYGAKADQNPSPTMVLHCLNGNLVRALIDLGWLDDPRLQGAIDWEARAITGEEGMRYFQSGTSGPGFACAANEKQPCAWGAVKAMLGLAAIPPSRRSALVSRAIDQGRAFLLSRDPAVADYPFPSYATRPNGSWFKLGFPSGYVTDVLQNLEALCEIGGADDPRISHAIELVLSKQNATGRWKNEYAYHGKTWLDIEKQGQPSKWVTLRACRVLKAQSEASATAAGTAPPPGS